MDLKKQWIDMAVGEPHIIREALFETFPIAKTSFVHLDKYRNSEYPLLGGYLPLKQYLEDKYQAPVVICNGAKQGIGAVFHVLNKMGKKRFGMRKPYWPLLISLAEIHGLNYSEKYDCYLAVLPNNPDSFMIDYDYLKYLASYHKHLKIPFIHDAAYFSSIYLNENYNMGPVGDVQIHSISKSLGLSGIRMGYVVCYNHDYYNTILDYVEQMTVGVSTLSQNYYYSLLMEFKNNPEKYSRFVAEAKNELYKAKFLARTIHKDVLEIPADIEQLPGMFLWAKLGPRCDFKRAKINVNNGQLFGVPGMVRINLGLQANLLKEAIARLNAL